MRRTVVIAGRKAPYILPKEEGDEIWTVNSAFMAPTNQKGVDRVYFMDPLVSLVKRYPSFVEEINKLECPVYAQRAYPEIPTSRPLPIADMIACLSGVRYFTSTLAYMIAHAIFERADRIILHRITSSADSVEYYHQKPCHDFWCGVALGLGIVVRTSDDSLLMKPHPWGPPLYGYWQGPEDCELYAEVNTALINLGKVPIEYREVTHVEGVSLPVPG